MTLWYILAAVVLVAVTAAIARFAVEDAPQDDFEAMVKLTMACGNIGRADAERMVRFALAERESHKREL